MNETNPMDILIDDVHVINNNASFFWNYLTELMTKNHQQNKRILLISRYGKLHHVETAPPIEFKSPLGLKHLRLSREEYELVITNVIQQFHVHLELFSDPPDVFEPEVKDWIYNLSCGHAGLMLSTLHFVMLKRVHSNITRASDIFWCLNSLEYNKFLEKTNPYSL